MAVSFVVGFVGLFSVQVRRRVKKQSLISVSSKLYAEMSDREPPLVIRSSSQL